MKLTIIICLCAIVMTSLVIAEHARHKAAALGLTTAQVDDLFILAASYA